MHPSDADDRYWLQWLVFHVLLELDEAGQASAATRAASLSLRPLVKAPTGAPPVVRFARHCH
jgi:hypothetical protein